MPITSVTTDPAAHTLTVIADFSVSVRRLWDAYMDPRQLERFWGPVEYPATFLSHNPVVGGDSHYMMTGPDGDRSFGYWIWMSLDSPKRFVVRDGFANEDGTPNAELPGMQLEFDFAETEQGSRMTTTATFASQHELEQSLDMGMELGMRSAMGQMDAVLAESIA